MADTLTAACAHIPATPVTPSVPDDESVLRESLRRCSPATIDAAIAYRKTGDAKHIPQIILGVFERFLEPELRPRLAGDSDDLRVIEDLGLDSLTMMEIVMLVEEVTRTRIENDELRGLVTIGDIKTFVDCRVRGVPPPAPTRHILGDDIRALMPIGAPFLFLDDARVGPAQAMASYRITGQEFFLAGHFKDNPVMPASIMLEALGQLGVLHLLSGLSVEDGKAVDASAIFFASTDGVRCSRVCKPGDVLTLNLKPKRVKAPLAVYSGSIRVGQEKAVVVEELTLTFALADAPAAAASRA